MSKFDWDSFIANIRKNPLFDEIFIKCGEDFIVAMDFWRMFKGETGPWKATSGGNFSLFMRELGHLMPDFKALKDEWYLNGNYYALLQLIETCALYKVFVPQWAALDFEKAVTAYARGNIEAAFKKRQTDYAATVRSKDKARARILYDELRNLGRPEKITKGVFSRALTEDGLDIHPKTCSNWLAEFKKDTGSNKAV